MPGHASACARNEVAPCTTSPPLTGVALFPPRGPKRGAVPSSYARYGLVLLPYGMVRRAREMDGLRVRELWFGVWA